MYLAFLPIEMISLIFNQLPILGIGHTNTGCKDIINFGEVINEDYEYLYKYNYPKLFKDIKNLKCNDWKELYIHTLCVTGDKDSEVENYGKFNPTNTPYYHRIYFEA